VRPGAPPAPPAAARRQVHVAAGDREIGSDGWISAAGKPTIPWHNYAASDIKYKEKIISAFLNFGPNSFFPP